MKRYESAIRTVGAFFAVLLGFGLKRLLDSADPAFEPLGGQYLCFLLCVLLFLRFLLGSSNHMWFEFVRPDLKTDSTWQSRPWLVMNDFAFLIVFGIVCMAMCYSAQIAQTVGAPHLATFLGFNAMLAAIAIAWGLAYEAKVPGGHWAFWVGINGVHLASVLIAWSLLPIEVRGWGASGAPERPPAW